MEPYQIAGALVVFGLLVGCAVLIRHQQDVLQSRQRRAADVAHRDDLLMKLVVYLWHHNDALLRQLRQKLYRDAYGKLKDERAWKEARYFFETVVLPELNPDNEADYQFLCGHFANWFNDLNLEDLLDSDLGPSAPRDGLSYERQVGASLAQLGFDVSFTPLSGDQGVDLVAQRGGCRVAFQCKNYAAAAGNDAVQQVFAGAKFYGAHQAIVVAPNGFTVAARQLAGNLNVACLHHDELSTYDFASGAAVAEGVGRD